MRKDVNLNQNTQPFIKNRNLRKTNIMLANLHKYIVVYLI